LSEREAVATIRSGLDAGKQEPRQAPQPERRLQDGPNAIGAEHPLPPYIDAADFLAEPMPLADPVIEGLLRRGETGTLVSSSKARKSWTAQEACIGVAIGGTWFGLACRPGRALLIDCELQRATLQYRLASVLHAKGLDMEDVRGRLAVASWRGQTVTLERLASFLAAIEPGEFDLIVADPVYAAMGALFSSFQALAERAKAALLLVAHTPKGDTSARATIDLVSGAGTVGRSVDVAIALRAHEASEPDRPAIVRETIARSFPAIPPACFRLEHPLWVPAPDLDPSDLKRPGGRRRKPKDRTPAAPTPSKPPVDEAADFASRFIDDEPRPRAAIIDMAIQDGLSERRAKSLLERAEGRGLVYRWTFGPRKPARFAATEQPAPDPHEGDS